MSDSSRPHGLQPTRLLCPWDLPGKRTGVGCRCLLRPILLGCLKALGWAPCVIQRVPTGYLFCIRWYVSFSATFSICPTLFSRYFYILCVYSHWINLFSRYVFAKMMLLLTCANGRPDVLRFMGSQSRTRLSNWTELNLINIINHPTDSVWNESLSWGCLPKSSENSLILGSWYGGKFSLVSFFFFIEYCQYNRIRLRVFQII